MQVSSSSSRSIRFGAFELDLRAGELRKQGFKVKLQEQPLQILMILVGSPGQVVTREELRSRLWPADTFVDFDHGLNKAINKLREALGDSAEEPRFIETLARRGYRFVAPINEGREAQQKRNGAIQSIAVFPLVMSNPDPDMECLAIGIPGGIIQSLSQIPALRVIAWSNVAGRKEEKRDPLEIGASVGAHAILIGRIWQRANKLRIQVDLVDTSGGEELWGEQYDRDLTELFAIQDDISREVAQKLKLKMSGESQSRLYKRYTENIEAYQLYVRARRWCERRSAEGFSRATEYLTQAIAIDPNYALAHAELAQCISVPAYYGAVDPNVAYPRARTAALRALDIDPNLAEGHEILATVLKSYDWNWNDAEAEYKRAIELNPNYATAHYHYSYFLAESGRFEEAIREATEALSRDPMSGLLNAGLAFVLLETRRFDEAIEQARTASEVDPEMVLCYWILGTAYEKKGMYPRAIEAYEKSIDLGGAVGFSTAFISHAYATAGQVSKAWEAVAELQEISKTRYVPWTALMIAYDGLREMDLAMKALNRAYENRETNLVLLKVWPHFDNLRHDARFQEIERRVGLRKASQSSD